jgi:tetratricopeptide (TPR) repeat protein
VLYLAQMSSGDERARYLQNCIEKYNDCFYDDGVQVGAYARFILAEDYKSQGETDKAQALFDEIKSKYPDAIDHAGNSVPSTNSTVADTNNNTGAAIAAAGTWLKLIDEGQYAESHRAAAKYFQGAVTETAWENSMETFRKPLGTVVSRSLKSAVSHPELPGAPDGSYVVMQFDTSFTDKKVSVETVTFMLEKDGQWRAAGYYIK